MNYIKILPHCMHSEVVKYGDVHVSVFYVCFEKTLARLKACPHWARIQSALNADPLNAHSIYIDRVHTAK